LSKRISGLERRTNFGNRRCYSLRAFEQIPQSKIAFRDSIYKHKGDLVGATAEIVDLSGDLSRTRDTTCDVITCANPDIFLEVVNSPFFRDRKASPYFKITYDILSGDPNLPGGFINRSGADWLQVRSVANKSLLVPSSLPDLMPATHTAVETLIENFKKSPESPDTSQIFSRYTFDVLVRSSFGSDQFVLDRFEDIITTVKEWFHLGTKYIALDNVENILLEDKQKLETTLGVVAEVINYLIEAERANSNPSPNIVGKFSSLKDDNGQFLTPSDIRPVIFDLLAGGIDTTSTTLEYALYLLAKHPEVQEKLFEEIKSVPPQYSYQDLNKLSYLECVLKESMRIYPAAPINGRETYKEGASVGGI
jgi:cytochrome P450